MADVYEARPAADDAWSPARPVRSSAAAGTSGASPMSYGMPAPAPASAPSPTTTWAGVHLAGASSPTAVGALSGAALSASTWPDIEPPSAPSARDVRGLPGWVALLVMIAVTALGGVIDAVRGQQLGNGFNVGIIAGSLIAIVFVRRPAMFPVVVAPPIVYSLGAGLSLYLRSNGLSDHNVLIDAAANWLVYGFPSIAAATAVVLIVAGIRLIVRR